MLFDFTTIQCVDSAETGQDLIEKVQKEIEYRNNLLSSSKTDRDIAVFTKNIETLELYIEDIRIKLQGIS